MGPAEKKRLAYLDAMGIQVWTPRAVEPASARAGQPDSDTAPAAIVEPPPRALGSSQRVAVHGAQPAAGQGTPQDTDSAISVFPLTVGEVAGATPLCGWETLEPQVAACTACSLHQSRTQTVFGVGDRHAQWLVIGEAPGEQEDLQGEPFVGPAGQLLNEMLRAVGLAREQVYIANILKCRPPRNRDPQAEEVAACEHYLKQQLMLVKPRIILAVGRIAAQNLLKMDTPIGKLRGHVHRYEQIPLVVTYHPAYLLRSPREKRRAWDDLRLALKTYRQLQ